MTRKDKDENKNLIYEVREYRTQDGRHVVAQTPLDGSAIVYVGNATGQIRNTAGQEAKIPYTFTIGAESIEDAFSKFNETAQKVWPDIVEQFKAQMQAQNKRIVTARSVDQMLMQPPGGNGGEMRIVK